MMKQAIELFDIDHAYKAAIGIIEFLSPACSRLELAGSVRRGNKHQVHDIDLVAYAVYEDYTQRNLLGEEQWVHTGPNRLVRLIRTFTEIKEPEVDVKILKFTWDCMPVEIYLSERDGSNFEALLQMRTGGAAHNAFLARRAMELRLEYKAGYGVFSSGHRIDDGTEQGIYTALRLPYTIPSKRF
jgi:DNA polymerase/3'-5' exonuclease PolX